MKNLVLVLFLGLFLVSCKTNSIVYDNKDFVNHTKNSEPYTMSTVRKLQEADAKFISENYTEEEKREFAKRFFYKEIKFSNDTLIAIK
jgi:type IV secretory pathway VirD2 relaxase